jgi:hypothetical protein
MHESPPSGIKPCAIPLRATQSETRILHELLGISKLRAANSQDKWQDSDYLKSMGIETAAACIEAMRAELFPLETALRKRRAEALREINGGPVKSHFDNTLETASLTINAHIKNKSDYDTLLTKLQAFDFSAWQQHCESERIDAD